jgi:hypothetical protein
MSDTKRPFEVGDLVIIPSYRTEGIITCITDTCISVDDGTEDGFGYNPNLIKTIRTHRKGSEEARAIVAIAAAYYRAKLNKRVRHMMSYYNQKWEEAFEDARECVQDSVIFVLYQEQKAMLK